MIRIKQLEFKSILEKEFDLIITASGFEIRSTFQASKIKLQNARKISLGFPSEMDDSIRKSNDDFFRKNEFEIIISDSQESNSGFFMNLIDQFLSQTNKEEVAVYIDYSCMTRNWYAQLIFYFEKQSFKKCIALYFSYSFAEYEKAGDEHMPNKIVEPIFGFCSMSLPVKPTALVLCLGNELNRAYGLKEYFDAATYLFYSDPQFSKEFSNEVICVNEDIIKNTPPENIFEYPITNVAMTDYILNNLCKVLSEKYRVVIAPCGPKPFILLSLICSLNQKGKIDVWRISAGDNQIKYKRKPNGEVLTMELTFQPKGN
jgi:hypothetical protein